MALRNNGLLETAEVGDRYMHNPHGEMYEIDALYTFEGSTDLQLRPVGRYSHQDAFSYNRDSFKNLKLELISTKVDRLPREAGAMIYFLAKTGGISEIHDLLVRLEI